MAYVKAKPGETVDSLLRRFKKAVDNSGVLSDLKKREFYEKPSVKRKKKRIAAQKRAAKRKVREKTRNISFKWNKDHTKKLPLRSNYRNNRNNTSNNRGGNNNRGNYRGNNSNYKGNRPYRKNTDTNSKSSRGK